MWLQAPCPPIPNTTPAWVTALIGSLSGLLVGLIAEPIKNQIQFYMHGYRARKAILEELHVTVKRIIQDYQYPSTVKNELIKGGTALKYYSEHYPEQFIAYSSLRQLGTLSAYFGPMHEEHFKKVGDEGVRNWVLMFINMVLVQAELGNVDQKTAQLIKNSKLQSIIDQLVESSIKKSLPVTPQQFNQQAGATLGQ